MPPPRSEPTAGASKSAPRRTIQSTGQPGRRIANIASGVISA